MSSKNWLTDEQVEKEIVALRDDPDVKLARAETRERYKRRQQLYNLRDLKKRGQKIRNDPEFQWLVDAVEGDEKEGGTS